MHMDSVAYYKYCTYVWGHLNYTRLKLTSEFRKVSSFLKTESAVLNLILKEPYYVRTKGRRCFGIHT